MSRSESDTRRRRSVEGQTRPTPMDASPGGRRIEDAIRRRTAKGESALIPFFTAGDPDAGTTLARVDVAVRAGADVLELGLPFSDPVADGPVLQAASQRALKGGGGRKVTLEIAKEVRARYPDLPIVILTYLNPIFHAGYGVFGRLARESGVDGVLVPDLSLEESPVVREAFHGAGVALIPFAAPTSGQKRLEKMARVAEGFVYSVARLGVTGAASTLATSAQAVAEAVRAVTAVPVAIGFGVGSAEAARQAARYADAVIVGSALAANSGDASRPLGLDGVHSLLMAMRAAMDAEPVAVPGQARTVPDVGREGR